MKACCSYLKGQANKSLEGLFVAEEACRAPAEKQALWRAGNAFCAASQANE
jgi:hypothetical protein